MMTADPPITVPLATVPAIPVSALHYTLYKVFPCPSLDYLTYKLLPTIPSPR